MSRRLIEDLVMPKAQTIDFQQLRGGPGQARIKDKLPQSLINPPASQEVTDHVFRVLCVSSLHLIQLRLQGIEILAQVIHPLAQVQDLLHFQNRHRPQESIPLEVRDLSRGKGRGLTVFRHESEGTGVMPPNLKCLH